MQAESAENSAVWWDHNLLPKSETVSRQLHQRTEPAWVAVGTLLGACTEVKAGGTAGVQGR